MSHPNHAPGNSRRPRPRNTSAFASHPACAPRILRPPAPPRISSPSRWPSAARRSSTAFHLAAVRLSSFGDPADASAEHPATSQPDIAAPVDISPQPTPSFPTLPPGEQNTVAKGKKTKKLDGDISEILAFGFPVLGGLIADPLMALVDTACCGQIGTVQLAALGPVGNIFLFVVQVFSFLGTATTNVVAQNAVDPTDTPEMVATKHQNSTRALSHGLIVALIAGSAMAALLLVFAKPMLLAMGTSPQVMPYSLAYMRVRCLGVPGIFLMTVAQGACLGVQDAWSPLLIYLVAGVVNLFGDIYLIFHLGLGVTGAAVATTLSVWAGTIFFLYWLRRSTTETTNMTANGSNDPALELKWMGMPTRESLKPFAKVGNALLVRQVASMGAYTSLTTMATRMGTIPLATHQIALQLFWFLSFLPEPLSVCGQSMVSRQIRNPVRLKDLARKLIKLSVIIGVGACVPLFCAHMFFAHMFTTDVRVMNGLRKVLGFSMLSQIMLSSVIAFDGIAIGSGDYNFLPLSNAIAFGATWAGFYLFRTYLNGIIAVWAAMAAFAGTRLLCHLLRARSQRKRYGQWPVPVSSAD